MYCSVKRPRNISNRKYYVRTTIVEEPVMANTVQMRSISRYQANVCRAGIGLGAKKRCHIVMGFSFGGTFFVVVKPLHLALSSRLRNGCLMVGGRVDFVGAIGRVLAIRMRPSALLRQAY